MRQDDGLNPITEFKLAQDVAWWVFTVVSLQKEPLGDLCIAETPTYESQHLALPIQSTE